MKRFIALIAFFGLIGYGGSVLAAARGSFSLDAARKVVTAGETFTVTIRSEANEAVNAFQVLVRFPTELLEVTSVEQVGSWATIWVTESPKFSNVDGTVSFQGGTPNPGFTGEGVVGRVIFRGKATGRADVVISRDSKLLANDGLGTNILSATDSARLTIVNVGEAARYGNLGWWIAGIVATLLLGGVLLKYRKR